VFIADTFETAPEDVIFLFLKELPYKDIISFSETNKRNRRIAQTYWETTEGLQKGKAHFRPRLNDILNNLEKLKGLGSSYILHFLCVLHEELSLFQKLFEGNSPETQNIRNERFPNVMKQRIISEKLDVLLKHINAAIETQKDKVAEALLFLTNPENGLPFIIEAIKNFSSKLSNLISKFSSEPAQEQVQAKHKLHALVAAGVNLNSTCNEKAEPPLFSALGEQKNKLLVSELISLGADVNFRNRYGNSAMTYAENLEIVQVLYEKGLQLEKEEFASFPALVSQASKGRLNIVRFLVEKGYSVNTKCKKTHSTPLMLACRRNKSDVVAFLLTVPDIAINEKDADGISALEHSIKVDSVDCALKLIAHGAEINFDYGLMDHKIEKYMTSATNFDVILGKHLLKKLFAQAGYEHRKRALFEKLLLSFPAPLYSLFVTEGLPIPEIKPEKIETIIKAHLGRGHPSQANIIINMFHVRIDNSFLRIYVQKLQTAAILQCGEFVIKLEREKRLGTSLEELHQLEKNHDIELNKRIEIFCKALAWVITNHRGTLNLREFSDDPNIKPFLKKIILDFLPENSNELLLELGENPYAPPPPTQDQIIRNNLQNFVHDYLKILTGEEHPQLSHVGFFSRKAHAKGIEIISRISAALTGSTSEAELESLWEDVFIFYSEQKRTENPRSICYQMQKLRRHGEAPPSPSP